MTSEIGRMLKILKPKPSYRTLQDDAYSHISLLPEEDLTARNGEPLVAQTSTSSEGQGDELQRPSTNKSNSGESHFKVSASDKGNINDPSAINRGNDSNVIDIVTDEFSSSSSGVFCEETDFSSNQLTPSSSQSYSGSGTSGQSNSLSSKGNNNRGILSCLGFKINKKSSTRHLDRSSSQGDSVDKALEAVSSPNRYTKFPLRNSNRSHSETSEQYGINQSQPSPACSSSSSSAISSSSTKSAKERQQQDNLSPPEISSAPPSNSPFDISQIQSTAQTKIYSNPNRSPAPPNRKGSSFSPSTFLANAVSSFTKKSGSGSGGSKSNSSNFFSKLKVKSKSDNNLHRVDVNSVRNNAILTNLNIQSQGSSRGQINSRPITTSSQNIYNPEPANEVRLNSVQIGDHATIHLPWTGFQIQRNNSTSEASSRTRHNTHRNNLESSSTARYVECGFRSAPTTEPCFGLSSGVRQGLSSSSTHSRQPPNQSFNCIPSTTTGPVTTSKQRSKSLERDHNFRIISQNPICTSGGNSSIASSSSGAAVSPTENTKSKDTVSGIRSLERKHPQSLYSIRRSLTPEEQEILLRNIKWDLFSTETSSVAPPRPEKPASLKSLGTSELGLLPNNSCSCTSSASNKRSVFSTSKSRKPPLIGVLHKSAPNSYHNSTDSSDSASFSAPPSPPPRPLSSLKADSRLIVPPPQPLPRKATDFSGIFRSDKQPSFSSLNSGRDQSKNVSQGCHHHQECSSNSALFSHSSWTSSTTRRFSDFDFIGEIRRSLVFVPDSTHSLSSSSTCSTFSDSNYEKLELPMEEVRNTMFINKPAKGWLHSDKILAKEGVTYTVRYIGCLEVNTSMKTLDFDTRSLIAKECINQVCEAAGLKSADRRRRVDRQVGRILGLRPKLDYAGSDVRLTITSTCLKLTSLDNGAVIVKHELPNISFASGGDTASAMLDFVAYVGKDDNIGRACFILECGSGLAQDVITTIGQAFELRFQQYIQKRPPPPPSLRLQNDDPEYYNDLPGKVPPEALNKSQNGFGPSTSGKTLPVKSKEPPSLTLPVSSERELSVNLIDFEAPTPPAFGPSTQDRHLESLLLGADSPTVANVSATQSSHSRVGTGLGLPSSPNPTQSFRDPFDMQPFASTLSKPLSAEEQRKLLEAESWFHGTISRSEAEDLVQNEGDFLVRESQSASGPGQYVLTGLHNNCPKHLLLMDSDGVVRTKEQTFESVIHLIRHHRDNSLPIIAAESMVILRHPVQKIL